MTSSDLRFKITINAETKTVTFEDTAPYSVLISNENISGLLRIKDPLGNIVYQNAGYITDDYTSPDIIMAGSIQETISKSLNLNASSNIITGEYGVYYKVVNPETSGALTKNITSTATTLVIAGLSPTEATNLVKYGWINVLTGSTNTGFWKIASSSYDGSSDLTITLDATATVQTSTSSTIFYPDSDSDYSTDKNFDYCYTREEVSIGYVIDCGGSVLTTTDTTTYQAAINGVNTLATSYTRVHNVTAPIGSGYGGISSSSDKIRTFDNIWTKDWSIAISTTVVYNVEDWDGSTWYVITDTVTGSDTATVTCNSCSCELSTCISNLYNDWIAAIPNSRALADTLEVKVLKITSLYSQFLQAERCGEPTGEFCTAIAVILNSNECTCGSVEDTASVLIVATRDVTIGSRIYMENGVPASTLGRDYDMYIDETSYDVYYKESGAWTTSLNIKGGKGDTGAKGDTGENATPENFLVIEQSFEIGEVGTMEFMIPISCTISAISGVCSKDIEDSDNGTITFSKDAGADIGFITATAGDSLGEEYASIDIGTSFDGIAEKLTMVSAKPTAGGRVKLIIEYTKS